MTIERSKLSAAAAVAIGFVLSVSSHALAGPIPFGWTCTGNCGTLGPDGVVTAPPGGTDYQFISTFHGIDGIGQLPGIGGTDGSLLVTPLFSANGTDQLVFNFNFVTSDGTGQFPDYAWAELVPTVGAPIVLFDARTVAGAGNTVPGFGLPPIAVTLFPATSAIIPGGPVWSPLGDSSGQCYQGPGQGCGYTGWIKANFTPAAGNYTIQFGVSNFGDTALDTGLAIAGTKIGGIPIDGDDGVGGGEVPEPGTMTLLGLGLVGLAKKARSHRRSA
jgi:hypothetical protein